MAKFQRIGPVWRKPNPKPWKKLKACAANANRNQFLRDNDVNESLEVEILTGEGFGIVIEQSAANVLTYIAVEDSY